MSRVSQAFEGLHNSAVPSHSNQRCGNSCAVHSGSAQPCKYTHWKRSKNNSNYCPLTTIVSSCCSCTPSKGVGVALFYSKRAPNYLVQSTALWAACTPNCDSKQDCGCSATAASLICSTSKSFTEILHLRGHCLDSFFHTSLSRHLPERLQWKAKTGGC